MNEERLLRELQNALSDKLVNTQIVEPYEVNRLIIVTEQLCMITGAGQSLEEIQSPYTIEEFKEWLEETRRAQND